MTTHEIYTLNLGTVPVEVDPKAAALLSQLRPDALDTIIAGVREWTEQASVTCARVMHVVDAEDMAWEESVVELQMDPEAAPSSSAWDGVSAALDRAKARLNPPERAWVDRHFDVHLVW